MRAAAAVYVRPATHATALGVEFARLSQDPWARFGHAAGTIGPLSVGVEHRLLTPVISYLVGLRGERLIITNLLIAATLLGCVMVWFGRRSARPATPCSREAFLRSPSLRLRRSTTAGTATRPRT
jgi:hypothetical protein